VADFPNELLTCANDPGRLVWDVNNAEVAASPDLYGCAAIVETPRCRGFSAVSVYLLRPRNTGSPVPVIHWELRGRIAGTTQSELIPGASGTLSKFTTWNSEGSVVHVSGRRYLGFELWARSEGVAVPCMVQFIVAPSSAGAPLFVEPGALV
jgi:hypothetical protein